MKGIIGEYCSKEWQDFIKFHCVSKSYKPGETIFRIGDTTEGIFFINEGKVKISTSNANNTERIIRLAADGDILGHRGFGGSWKYSITATTFTDTTVNFLPIDIFNQAVKANPEFGFFMMMFFAEELRSSERLAKQLPVKNLVASSLYANFNAFGFEEGSDTKLSYTLSRKDIANKAGTTYESVVRSLAELNKEAIIKIEGKSIHILCLDCLKKMSSGISIITNHEAH